MFNKMLKTLEQPLNESLIKEFHYELKIGVFEDRANGYNVGEYKVRPNRVGMIQTTLPDCVHTEMEQLLSWYTSTDITLVTIAEFHAMYERIHPFQDGNGRTGRLLLYRECLRNGIVPFVVEDAVRPTYVRALSIAQSTGDLNSLITLFEIAQQNYYKQLQYFLREYNTNEVLLKQVNKFDEMAQQ